MIETNPTSISHVGTYTISLTVSDSDKSIITSYELTVSNTPPRFIATLPNKILSVNSKGSYDLSSFFVDDDGNPLTMTATSSYVGG
jgi:hypothetical protein